MKNAVIKLPSTAGHMASRCTHPPMASSFVRAAKRGKIG
jgi:hypothetical protein